MPQDWPRKTHCASLSSLGIGSEKGRFSLWETFSPFFSASGRAFPAKKWRGKKGLPSFSRPWERHFSHSHASAQKARPAPLGQWARQQLSLEASRAAFSQAVKGLRLVCAPSATERGIHLHYKRGRLGRNRTSRWRFEGWTEGWTTTTTRSKRRRRRKRWESSRALKLLSDCCPRLEEGAFANGSSSLFKSDNNQQTRTAINAPFHILGKGQKR